MVMITIVVLNSMFATRVCGNCITELQVSLWMIPHEEKNMIFYTEDGVDIGFG